MSLVVVAAATALTACTGDDESAPAARLLGDLATIDPCSLTTPEVFEEFGPVELAESGSFAHCAVLINPAGDDSADGSANSPEEITILVGGPHRPSAATSPAEPVLEDVADSIHTTEPRDMGVSCSQDLVFAEEDLALRVQSHLNPSARPVPTCDMVAAGMAKLVEVVLAEKVGHRSPPEDSLITRDPCDLVDDALVTALVGLADAQRVDRPDRHECRWRTSPGRDGLSATVTFGTGSLPQPHETTAFETGTDPIAGRPSVTTHIPSTPEGKGYCNVVTAHIPFDEIDGVADVVETARVEVEMPAGTLRGVAEGDEFGVGCEGAVSIAGALWPELPPA